jgi:glycosyltransferase involved in cell wall biosynthesis
MDLRAKCAAVIPCLNEQVSIAALVQEIRSQLARVIVVDDGSNDRTATEAGGAGAEVIRHETNRGKGEALRTGMHRAHELGFEWALTMDGDGQHEAGDISKFFECAEATGAKLVVGNRMGGARHMPWVRRMVNRWMSHRLSSAAGHEFPDSQCGFRLVNLQAWADVRLCTSHFEVESELLLAFAKAGFRVEFVTVQVIYKNEESKIHPFRDTIRWFRWWFSRS